MAQMAQSTLELNEVFLEHPVLMRIFFRFLERDFRIIKAGVGSITDDEGSQAAEHNKLVRNEQKITDGITDTKKVNEGVLVKTEEKVEKEMYGNEERIGERSNTVFNYIGKYYSALADNLKKLRKFYNDVIIRRVPKYIIGDGVLGRAFVYHNVIEVLDSLAGEDFQKVLKHEMYHIMNPAASEYQTRVATDTLYFRPRWY